MKDVGSGVRYTLTGWSAGVVRMRFYRELGGVDCSGLHAVKDRKIGMGGRLDLSWGEGLGIK